MYVNVTLSGGFSPIAAAEVATSSRLEEKCQSHSGAVKHFFLSALNLFVITTPEHQEGVKPILYFDLLYIELQYFKTYHYKEEP